MCESELNHVLHHELNLGSSINFEHHLNYYGHSWGAWLMMILVRSTSDDSIMCTSQGVLTINTFLILVYVFNKGLN